VSKTILIVGAGFAGATHARVLAEHGRRVDLIDRRRHLGGNAYDEIDDTGVRVHKYGPHLFHTNNAAVVNWLARFGEFVRYEHRVQALLADGRCVSLPINRKTINAVFGEQLNTESEVRAFLTRQAVANGTPANAAEYLYGKIGKTLTDLFFRPYTKKMWALDLDHLDVAVVKRIPIRYDDEERYYPTDQFQLLPSEGYARLFETILDHPNIRITLRQNFDHSHLHGYEHCFNSMAIDEFFDNALGPLPYRSIRFDHERRSTNSNRGDVAVINFTDECRWTRETDWSRLPNHWVRHGATKTVTREEPCDYRANNFERYYPIKTSDGRNDKLYQAYLTLADTIPNVTFIGRCGTYQYLDMHQVINQSLTSAQRWLHGETK
jgi:UDP-galactopyranose mutase